MAKTPPMNLSPESTPWGRWAQSEIEDLKRSAARREQAEANANQGQNGTLTALAKQIQTLNEAVANTVTFSSIGKSEMSFAVPSVMGDVAASVIVVPDGYTRAAILGVVSLGAYNTTATPGYVYLQAMINGTRGATMPAFGAANGGYVSFAASAIRVLEGLVPGASIDVSAQCQVDGGWPSAGTANIANIDVIALFRR